MARISNSKFKNGMASSTGVLTSVAAGTATGMTAIHNSHVRPGTLSATMVLDAETDTLTLSAGWQVADAAGGTWQTLAYAPNNPAAVVLATGTGGADAAVTAVIPCPESAAGHRFVRASVINGVAEGTVNDTYTVSYNYIQA